MHSEPDFKSVEITIIGSCVAASNLEGACLACKIREYHGGARLMDPLVAV